MVSVIIMEIRKRKGEENEYRLMTKQTKVDSNDFVGDYKPRTQETRQTYEILLATIQDAIGDQVICFNVVVLINPLSAS